MISGIVKRQPSKKELILQRIAEYRQPGVLEAFVELIDLERDRLADDFDASDGKYDMIIKGERRALKQLRDSLKRMVSGE